MMFLLATFTLNSMPVWARPLAIAINMARQEAHH